MNTVWAFRLVWMRVAHRHRHQFQMGKAIYESDDVAASPSILVVVPNFEPYAGL